MEKNDLIYDIPERPPFWRNLLFALQQLLAIIAATMLVPLIADKTGVYLSQSAALIGAGVGTIVYLILTQFKSPVFLGSSFTFITPLANALVFGYFGVLLGALFAGLVYVVLAIIIKLVGSDWLNKIMPPIIIGPTVALIGFDLASSAIANLMNTSNGVENYSLVAILVGILTFFIVIFVSVKGSKTLKMFPFIVGILGGYIIALILTFIGNLTGTKVLQLIDFSPFEKINDFSNWLPNITIIGLFKEGFNTIKSFGDVVTIFVSFAPVALVAFAEHIADHKNIGSIVNRDLMKDPGLHRTLLGDGLGSLVGSVFGGCPNTTYGESIGCVALSKNASTWTILTASIMCIIVAFIYPIVLFVETIPMCVIGGISIALYGFISVSGLRMFKEVDLNDSKNLFVVASIFICGIGGLEIKIGSVLISNIACALIVGILANVILKSKKSANISANPEILEGENLINSESPEKSENGGESQNMEDKK